MSDSFLQTVAIGWVFGAERFREAIRAMTGHQPPYIFYLCWKFLGPAVMAGVFVFYLASYSPVTYGDYQYPGWAEALGLGLSLASMVWVPLYALYYLCRAEGSLRQRLTAGLTPVIDVTRDNSRDLCGNTNVLCQSVNSLNNTKAVNGGENLTNI